VQLLDGQHIVSEQEGDLSLGSMAPVSVSGGSAATTRINLPTITNINH
jgi:hypothetical protein